MNCSFKQKTTIFIHVFSPPCRAITSCTSELSSLSCFYLPALPSCLVSTSFLRTQALLFTFFVFSSPFSTSFSLNSTNPSVYGVCLDSIFPFSHFNPIFIIVFSHFQTLYPAQLHTHLLNQLHTQFHTLSSILLLSSVHQIKLHICGTYACKRYIYSCRQTHGLDVRKNAKQNENACHSRVVRELWRARGMHLRKG